MTLAEVSLWEVAGVSAFYIIEVWTTFKTFVQVREKNAHWKTGEKSNFILI